jgi:hypothetical protein
MQTCNEKAIEPIVNQACVGTKSDRRNGDIPGGTS